MMNDFLRFSRMGNKSVRVFYESCSFDNGDVYCVFGDLLNT